MLTFFKLNSAIFFSSFALINHAKLVENKPIKDIFASLHSTPTRLQTTQFVKELSPSSNAVIDMDLLKTILFIALGLLVGIIPITLLSRLWYRRKYKPPASCKSTKSSPVAI